MPEAGTEPLAERTEQALLPQTTVWLMAITVGVIVANIYYVQPLLADIANTFGLSVTRAGTIAMLSQAGTALGMFLFVPLGDKYERRSLILLLVIGGFVSLLLMATAPNTCCRSVRRSSRRSATTWPCCGYRRGRNSFRRFTRTHI
jgi:predicted MFS family arabinose efflux permease